MHLMGGIEEFGILSTSQIRRLYFSEIRRTTSLRRLRALKKAGYLKTSTGLDHGELVWFLSQKGAKAIGSRFVMKTINRNVLSHDIQANDIKIKVDGLGIGKNWRSSHYLRHKANLKQVPEIRVKDTIPDWLFTLQKNGSDMACALELELQLKSKARIIETLLKYVDKKSIKFLWYVFPTRKFGDRYMEIFGELWNQPHKKWMGYCLQDEFLRHGLEANMHFLNESLPIADWISAKKVTKAG